MVKKRSIKNVKHRIAKARRIVRRKGDDWAELSNKQYLEVDRQNAKNSIQREMLNNATTAHEDGRSV